MTKQLLVVLILFSVSTESYAQGRFSFLNPANWGRGGDEAAEQARRNGDTPNGNQADQGDGLARTDVGSRTEILRLDQVIDRVQPNPNITGLEVSAYDVDAIIGRDKKAAPINVAPAGSGKSALVEYMQNLIESGHERMSNMRGKNLYYLNVNRLVGGTELQGSLQARFAAIVDEISDPANANKILVIDELEEVLKDEKHGLAFIENLKTYMAGEMRGAKLMFNITPPAYERLMKDPQLVRRMVPVFRDPPPDNTVRNIIKVLAENAKQRKGVQLTEDQLEQIFRLSKMHPTLANPDVAITILDDVVNMVLKDGSSGSRVFDQMRSKISDFNASLSAIRSGRDQGLLDYQGPFASFREERLQNLVDRAEGVLRSYDESRRETAPLRERLRELVIQRAELYAEARLAVRNQDFGDVDPMIRVNEYDEQIESVSQQLVDYDPLLTGLEPEERHIISSAEINLGGVSEGQIRDGINGGVGSDTIVGRILRDDSRLERNKVVIQSIVERVLTRRRLNPGNQNLPAFLIVDPYGSQQADSIVHAVTRGLYQQDTVHRINGGEILDRASLNTQIGAPPGYQGNGDLGSLFRAARDSNSFMSLLATRIDRATNHLTDLIEDLVVNRSRLSNHGENISFEDTTVFMTTSHADLRMTPEVFEEFNAIEDAMERQAFLRRFVQENFTGRSEGALAQESRLSDEFLSNVNVIYLDEATDLSADVLIVNELKSTSFKNTIERLGFKLDFDESTVDFLADRMRQLGGGNNVTQVVQDELLSEINRAFEAGTVIPGDMAVLRHNGDEFVFEAQPWENPSTRDELLAVHRAQFSPGAIEAEAPSSPRADVEDLLREMSEIVD